MSARRFNKHLRRFAFPACGWAVAVVYLLIVSGFSLPISSGDLKDHSTPFPCMDSPCGCKDAEQCWRHCCCHTLAERLAWARENGVTPPEFALAEARAQGIDLHGVCDGDCDGDCHAGTKTCCCCCKSHDHDAEIASQASAAKSTNAKRKAASGVILLSALKCGGFAGDFVGVGVAVPPLANNWTFSLDPTGSVIQQSAQLFDVAFPPPVPPPRSLTA
jgi:hypothetical protein